MKDLRKTCKQYNKSCNKLFENKDSCDICHLVTHRPASNYDSEFHKKLLTAAHMDSDEYIRAFCQLPELIKQRHETANAILTMVFVDQKNTAIECFEYLNEQIKRVLGL